MPSCLLLALSLCFCISGVAKEGGELLQLYEGIFARIVSPDGNAVGNAGVVVLDHSVLVYDTHFTPEGGQALRTAILAITSKPIRFVVNSHWHADHTHGNQVFRDAQLISSTNARRDVLQKELPSLNQAIGITQTQLETLRKEMGPDSDPNRVQQFRAQIKSREEYLQTLSHLHIVAPSLTVDDGMAIQDGKLEIRLVLLGTGHTDGDLVMFLPGQKIAFVGDLLFNQAIPNVQDANILSWMITLQAMLKLDADTFVPGHGPVGSRKDVEGFLDYFVTLKSLVEPVVDRGDSVEQAIREIQLPAKYSSYRFQNFFPSNVQKMYAELKALQLSSLPAEDPKKADGIKSSK